MYIKYYVYQVIIDTYALYISKWLWQSIPWYNKHVAVASSPVAFSKRTKCHMIRVDNTAQFSQANRISSCMWG